MSHAGSIGGGGSGPTSPDLHVAKWIVNPAGSSAGANQTTIAAALAAASAGDTIFVMPATYTENLTMKAGVNLVGFNGDQLIANVLIVGKITASFSGQASISGIRLQTGGDYAIQITGSNTLTLFITDCNIIGSDNDAISINNANSDVVIRYCSENISTGFKFFDLAAGFLHIDSNYCSGSSITSSTAEAGNLLMNYTTISNPIAVSGTCIAEINFCNFDTSLANILGLSLGSSASQTLDSTVFSSGTEASLAVITNAVLSNCSFDSTNVNPVTNSGTVQISNISFTNTGVGISPTISSLKQQVGNLFIADQGSVSNAVPLVIDSVTGEVGAGTASSVNFQAQMSSTASGVTGDGTNYTLLCDQVNSSIGGGYDNGTGIFTAPKAGLYQFNATIVYEGIGLGHTGLQALFVMNSTPGDGGPIAQLNPSTIAFLGSLAINGSLIKFMNATDSMSVQTTVTDSTKTVDIDGVGSPSLLSSFSGNLIS